jgi:membrane protein required for colicin V production
MNYIDIIFLVLLALFSWQGFRRGFVIELASLAALVLGIYAALYFSGYVADFLSNSLSMGPQYVKVVAFLITFIVIVFLVYALGRLLEKLVDMVALGFVNKIAGVVFGILKGAVLISIVLMIINYFNEDFVSAEKKEGSLLYEPIEGIAPLLWEKLQDWDLDDPKIKDLQEDMEKMTV